MNKLKTAIRNAEVDELSDLIIRNFKADEKAQSDSFLKSVFEEAKKNIIPQKKSLKKKYYQ